MRILYISFLGSWTMPLLDAIKKSHCVSLLIPVIGGTKDTIEQKNGITFYSVAFSSKECYTDMMPYTFTKYKKVIDDCKPDIIHVHGTEKNLAQIQNYIHDIPIVVSIQGLLTGCKDYAMNYLDRQAVSGCKTLKNFLGRGGADSMYKSFCKGSVYETDILNKGNYFIGRTQWDKAHILFHNPKAEYYQGEELLREEFYSKAGSWQIEQCDRHSIFMPSGFNPIKGLHLAVKTVYLLKQFYDDVCLMVPGLVPDLMGHNKWGSRIFGEEYIIYVRKLVIKYGLEKNIVFLPRLDAMGMIRRMQQANAFLSPSSIDNSPNAVGEATMIGTPVVTTPVGGVPSFLTDGSTALFAPAGDPYMMAFQLKRIFDNDDLAISLSRQAHQLALIRHDRTKTAEQYLNAYQDIINNYHESPSHIK